MKIGFAISTISPNETRWGTNTLSHLAELGFDCIDFQMGITETKLYSMTDEELIEFTSNEKKLAADAGISIHQAHGPWRWPPRDLTAEDRAERMEKMKRSIYIAHLLGCPNWIVHPIMPFGIEDINTENAAKTWEMNVEFMTELLKTAEEYDVTICLENMPMPKFSIATPEKILEFVRLMNSNHFKICLDTGHVAVFKNLSISEEVRRLGKYIATLHVHDNDGTRDQHLFPCFGKIDWNEFATALREVGFDGTFSLEAAPPTTLSTPTYEKFLIALQGLAKDIINT